MIAWFARNDVAANLLMLTLLVLGIGSLVLHVPLEVFPADEPRMVQVQVTLRGATPEEVETAVSIKLEEAVQDLEGIVSIVSTSEEGQAELKLELDDGYDANDLLAQIKNRIDALNTLPSDAERPVVSLDERRNEVIAVAVAGQLSELELRQLAERTRDDLLRIDGITQIELDGVRDYEIRIEVDARQLARYGITLETLADAIARSSRDLSAGNLKTSGGDVLIRSSGQAYNQAEFERIVVLAEPGGTQVTVADLARVIDGFGQTEVRTRFDGQNAAMIEVYRVGDQSAIDVARKVRDYVADKQDTLPDGVTLSTWRDRSQLVAKRLNTLVTNAIQGGILVFLLLTLFLRPAIAFWVCVGIPVAFMGAFLLMPVVGITLNVISLFGFILVLGIVVDDAIVTGENIYSHLHTSESSLDAVIKGTQEVAVPVTFGVLTTVAAFLPIAFIEGDQGRRFASISWVVIPILLLSLVESKLILPAHLKHLRMRRTAGQNRFDRYQQAFASGFERAVLRYYQPALSWVLRFRYPVLAGSIGVLILMSTMFSSGWIKFIFFPKVQSEVARGFLEMPVGTPFELTDQVIVRMTEAAEQLQKKYQGTTPDQDVIMNILSTSGGQTSHSGRVVFEIRPPEERTSDITSTQLVDEWRRLIGPVPGVESLTFRAEVGRRSDPIDIQLTGRDFEQLAQVAERIKTKLAEYPTVFDIGDSFSDGKEALELIPKPEAALLGLSREQILTQVRQAFFGYDVQRIQRGRDDVRVIVSYAEADRQTLRSLDQYLIQSPNGARIPLSQLVDYAPESSPAQIERINLQRTVNVTADIDKQNTNMVVLQGELETWLNALLQQFPGVSYSLEGEAKEQRQSFGSLQWGLGIVLFLIYCLLAIPFKSYLQPLIVMAIIPFGVIGAVLGHFLMGMDLTLLSLLGMLALVGIVVNDSLVLVDFVNQRRRDDLPLEQVVRHAASARFRPVFLTSATTFLGLMPLLFEQSTQAQFLIPMAVSLGFGILFATVITLFLVPINYMVLEDCRQLWRWSMQPAPLRSDKEPDAS